MMMDIEVCGVGKPPRCTSASSRLVTSMENKRLSRVMIFERKWLSREYMLKPDDSHGYVSFDEYDGPHQV
jgi:hypothetical protein